MNEKDNGTAQSSVYPVRPGQKDCDFYLKTGQCGYRDCRYNHPKDIPPVKFNMPKCKYFLKGYCKHGSDCVYDHSWERDVAEHMRQAKTILGLEKNLQEQRQVNVEKQRIESLRETQENHNDEQNLEEQRKRDIERQRREARLRTEQIKQTVHFDDAIRVRKLLTEFGIILTEGDGF